MKFGLVVTDDRFHEEAVALLQAALDRRWEARCFMTSDGVRLLVHPAFQELAANIGAAVCELSVERHADVANAAHRMEDTIIIGGQYHDAELVHHCDRVLVL